MHIHQWEWNEKRRQWECPCGEVVTLIEFKVEYGQHGNLDVDPIPALNRLAAHQRKAVA